MRNKYCTHTPTLLVLASRPSGLAKCAAFFHFSVGFIMIQVFYSQMIHICFMNTLILHWDWHFVPLDCRQRGELNTNCSLTTGSIVDSSVDHQRQFIDQVNYEIHSVSHQINNGTRKKSCLQLINNNWAPHALCRDPVSHQIVRHTFSPRLFLDTKNKTVPHIGSTVQSVSVVAPLWPVVIGSSASFCSEPEQQLLLPRQPLLKAITSMAAHYYHSIIHLNFLQWSCNDNYLFAGQPVWDQLKNCFMSSLCLVQTLFTVGRRPQQLTYYI